MINNILIGGGVSVSNISYIGDSEQIGYFSNGDSIGMSSGIVMSSGRAVDADLGGNPATPGFNSTCDHTLTNTVCNDLYNVANLVPNLINQSFSVSDINDMCVL